ncbi:replication initiation protein [Persicimonas caeni]|uniref:Replication initiation protein n=1 Tax=Persicimonas caeni TaxID=2292766 RepID=A0A4Y6PMM2_PERCE|nr:penicillin-insensitive murein endopeptidase [Persicimonas caeni]QDG49556.1 replication initiation protein [Persicimonas caeni]QED30777.1 replication initiation protein [Persicimonas caeni]
MKLVPSKGIIVLFVLLLLAAVHSGNDVLRLFESDAPSRSAGSTSAGELVDGKRLPSHGENFVTYSRFGSLIGRTCVPDDVREVALTAYATLAADMPDTTFTYGETAWCWGGGRLRPHRTHQNGLSVDFMVPVVDEADEPASFPAWPWTKFGYGVDFDASGKGDGLSIDFDALAAHLLALDDAAREHGVKIRRVIFAPDLRGELFRAKGGQEVRRRIRFMPGKAWVRHDEHYHVDFSL